MRGILLTPGVSRLGAMPGHQVQCWRVYVPPTSELAGSHALTRLLSIGCALCAPCAEEQNNKVVRVIGDSLLSLDVPAGRQVSWPTSCGNRACGKHAGTDRGALIAQCRAVGRVASRSGP